MAYHCLWSLGFQDTDTRVLAHSLLGCAVYGAFATKVTIVRSTGLPGLALPVAGGFMFAMLIGAWLTSALWFIDEQRLARRLILLSGIDRVVRAGRLVPRAVLVIMLFVGPQVMAEDKPAEEGGEAAGAAPYADPADSGDRLGAGGDTGGEAASAGEALFTDNCGACHTLSAAGTSGIVGPSLDGTSLDVAVIAAIVRDGRGSMPAFGGELSDGDHFRGRRLRGGARSGRAAGPPRTCGLAGAALAHAPLIRCRVGPRRLALVRGTPAAWRRRGPARPPAAAPRCGGEAAPEAFGSCTALIPFGRRFAPRGPGAGPPLHPWTTSCWSRRCAATAAPYPRCHHPEADRDRRW